MTARRMGHGPRLGLAIVAIAAAPYLAGCDAAPPAADGAIDYAMVCATREADPVRLPDDDCVERGGPRGSYARGAWYSAALPASPLGEVPATAYDEDGFPYESTTMVPDTDDGGVIIVPIGQRLAPAGGFAAQRAWTRGGAPAGASAGRVARGAARAGGVLTRSGAGTAGLGAPGAKVSAVSGPVARTASPFVSRGGLGPAAKASGASASSGS